MITGTSRFHARPGLARPEPAAQLEPGGVGQDRVQEDEIGSLRLDELERRGGPVGGEDLEAVVAQLLGEERPRGLLVLDDQDGFPHAGDASNGFRLSQMSFLTGPSRAMRSVPTAVTLGQGLLSVAGRANDDVLGPGQDAEADVAGLTVSSAVARSSYSPRARRSMRQRACA